MTKNISCEWCSSTFKKKSSVHKFCSSTCRKKANRNKNGEPLIPSFIGKGKKAYPLPYSGSGVSTSRTSVKSVKTPAMAEIQTRINWLESQKLSTVPKTGLIYGVGAVVTSRMLVKDYKINLAIGLMAFLIGKQNDSDRIKSNELQNGNFQRQIDELWTDVIKEKDRIQNFPKPPTANHDNFKLISASRVSELSHEKYDLTSKWKYFLSYLPLSFNAIIYGLPKAGKTHLAIQFAQYLEGNFGGVMYISGEEGVEQPFNKKLLRYRSNFKVAYDVKGNQGITEAIQRTNPKFVFIDSLNRLGLDVRDIIEFKSKFPKTVFIYILQSTKDGNFRGDQSIQHEVTSTIKVIDGVAYQKGRTVQEPTEIAVFEDVKKA